MTILLTYALGICLTSIIYMVYAKRGWLDDTVNITAYGIFFGIIWPFALCGLVLYGIASVIRKLLGYVD